MSTFLRMPSRKVPLKKITKSHKIQTKSFQLLFLTDILQETKHFLFFLAHFLAHFQNDLNFFFLLSINEKNLWRFDLLRFWKIEKTSFSIFFLLFLTLMKESKTITTAAFIISLNFENSQNTVKQKLEYERF